MSGFTVCLNRRRSSADHGHTVPSLIIRWRLSQIPASPRGEPRCLVMGCSFSVRLTPKMLSLQPCLSQAWGFTRFKYGLAHFLALWSCSATMGVPFPAGSSSTTMNLRPLGTSTIFGQSESERERSSRTGNSRESMYPFLDTLPLLLLLCW